MTPIDRFYFVTFRNVEGCSCHVNPPCSGCVEAPLVCPGCHYLWYGLGDERNA